AQTATELAEAIMAVDDKLKPFVLVVSNDPQLSESKESDKTYQLSGKSSQPSERSSQPPAHKRDRLLVADVSTPIIAVANTRNARSVLAVADVTVMLDYYHPEICNISHIQVEGEPDPSDPTRTRDLSWSWWLSKPVQIYLHEQLNPRDGGLSKQIN